MAASISVRHPSTKTISGIGARPQARAVVQSPAGNRLRRAATTAWSGRLSQAGVSRGTSAGAMQEGLHVLVIQVHEKCDDVAGTAFGERFGERSRFRRAHANRRRR